MLSFKGEQDLDGSWRLGNLSLFKSEHRNCTYGITGCFYNLSSAAARGELLVVPSKRFAENDFQKVRLSGHSTECLCPFMPNIRLSVCPQCLGACSMVKEFLHIRAVTLKADFLPSTMNTSQDGKVWPFHTAAEQPRQWESVWCVNFLHKIFLSSQRSKQVVSWGLVTSVLCWHVLEINMSLMPCCFWEAGGMLLSNLLTKKLHLIIQMNAIIL